MNSVQDFQRLQGLKDKAQSLWDRMKAEAEVLSDIEIQPCSTFDLVMLLLLKHDLLQREEPNPTRGGSFLQERTSGDRCD